MTPPLVYCETNWLVALAFPHHELHGAATRLRADAASGKCRLRVPVASFLEARRPLNEISSRISDSFGALRDDLARAVQNGWSKLTDLAAVFEATADVDESLAATCSPCSTRSRRTRPSRSSETCLRG